MSTGGYMLLDGHHRWLAAHRLRMASLPVSIMNVTPVEQILSAVAKSGSRICASFDLDEVLLTGQEPTASHSAASTSILHLFRRRLKKNAPALINELKKLGIDVWVYSSSYMDSEQLHKLFRSRRMNVDGIVSGTRNKQQRDLIRKAFTEKYELSLHVDTQCVTWVDTRTRVYDQIPLNCSGDDWSAKAYRTVKELPRVR